MINSSSLVNKKIRVRKVRSQNPRGFGGAIFSGYAIHDNGDVIDAKETIVIKAPFTLLSGVLIEKGQWWEVFGERKVYFNVINGYKHKELEILPQQMQLLRPSGEHIVRFLDDNNAFKGIGGVTARQLWEQFGEELYHILDNADVSKISEVVTSSLKANHLIDAWQQYGDTKTLQWFVQKGISVTIGKKLLAFYGSDTPKKIEEDPYRLLSFNGSWKATDAIAINTFFIKKDDPRRLQGAVEEVLYNRLDKNGDTAVPLQQMFIALRKLLKTNEYNWTEIVIKALKEGIGKGSFVIRNAEDIVLHALGPYVMEKTIAQQIACRILMEEDTLNIHIIDQQLNDFEKKSGFVLNTEQRQAVAITASNTFSIIAGGAGTGKTTVLEALYQTYDKLGIKIQQMALSGKATKRMIEATGREATTIAGFLHNIKTTNFNNNTVIVIDEASLVDVGTMYRVLKHIPLETRIVLVGDSGQLPPIGAGLVLHTLLLNKNIPVTELKVVNRYGGMIAKAAASIREGIWLDLSQNIDDEICFISCSRDELIKNILSLYTMYYEENSNIQILEPIKKGSFFGTTHTNKSCQELFADKGKLIKVKNQEFDVLEALAIREGEPVLCTQNHWDKELQNGSLGRVVCVYDEPREAFDEDSSAIGVAYADIEWDDGKIRPLTEDLVDDIVLAYSITIHKAQGSQWDTIIIPIYPARNMDRSMLYTAMTRAQKKVIFIGDLEIAKKIVQEMPKVFKRKTGLLDFINEDLKKKELKC